MIETSKNFVIFEDTNSCEAYIVKQLIKSSEKTFVAKVTTQEGPQPSCFAVTKAVCKSFLQTDVSERIAHFAQETKYPYNVR